MFTDKQKIILSQLGEQMVPLDHCGAVINMTRKDFLEQYEEDKDAQLHYEKGLSKASIMIMKTIKENSQKDFKSLEYTATNVLNVKKTTATKKENVVKPKVEEFSEDNWI